ncbi:hypothetical protein N0V88_004626 [Collariella sp. IMI 366227]|nr:hypothetical protein N0V88_004626 [Collariella sp. IMI 366227]
MALLNAHRKLQRLFLVAAIFLITFFFLVPTEYFPQRAKWQEWKYTPTSFDWGKRPFTNPIDESSMTPLPTGIPRQLPRIQHEFIHEELSRSHNKTQRARRDAVRKAAKKSWKAYRDHAWGRDEVAPQQLIGKDTFAGWGATLVDSLDTLWIMDMKKDFMDALRHVATIDWSNSTSQYCSLFETNIRYLGGLLSAYDLSQEQMLLNKAIELGSTNEGTAAVGSLSLEFSRLSQLTGNPKYYHAIDNIKKALARTQDSTNLPGMWPIFVDLQNNFFTSGTSFSLGASADSAYEYLSKMHILLGGLDPTYQKLHTKAMATAQNHLLFRPMLPLSSPSSPTPDILFSGTALSNGQIIELLPEVQHLGCFAGGMFALGGRLFHNAEHVTVGERLARGCAWAYAAFSTGVMPEVSEIIPCQKDANRAKIDDGLGVLCAWNETQWLEGTGKHPRPFSMVRNPEYLLRPEAIESLFVLYRVTGKTDLLDAAWEMFESVRAATETRFAFSAISDVQAKGYTVKMDAMESFWIAETLKYFYLIFSEPDLISLDDYVFNTEAHPLKIPKPGI